jgi:hypothetical protein
MATEAQRTELRDLIGDPSGAAQTWSDASLNTYIDKHSGDMFATAAYVLTIWAAKLAREFDFTAPEAGTFNRSQQREALLELANHYRKFAGSTTGSFVGGGFSVGERTRSDERWHDTLVVMPETAGESADPGATVVEDIDADELV